MIPPVPSAPRVLILVDPEYRVVPVAWFRVPTVENGLAVWHAERRAIAGVVLRHRRPPHSRVGRVPILPVRRVVVPLPVQLLPRHWPPRRVPILLVGYANYC